jgi:starch synthase
MAKKIETIKKETTKKAAVKKESPLPASGHPPFDKGGKKAASPTTDNRSPTTDHPNGKAVKKAAVGHGSPTLQAKKKILYVASEAGPFIRTGGLGDVAASLPIALNGLGYDVRVVLPYYSDIACELKDKMTFVGSTYVPLAWRNQYCGVYKATVSDGVTYYFIDNEYYFKRNGLYGHFDDAERFAFFAKAVLQALPVIDFYPDIIHCNDWHSGMIPVFLDAFFRTNENYRNIKTVFTIHNIEFQGKYGRNIAPDILGLPLDKYPITEYAGCINFMKGAIEASNVVTTVSKTYASEILNPFYSYGLEDILSVRAYKLKGVVNGIDYTVYNPMTDTALFKNYSLATVADKEENKKALLNMAGLDYVEGKPLLAMVTRLTAQKGMDLVSMVKDEILGMDIQMIVLGKGDWKYENMMREIEEEYPNKFKVIDLFSMEIAAQIYAGADLFLMPSKFEPCGLSQMIAMRYGTIPIVRETGGLKDTVQAFNPHDNTGTGFTFKSYNAYDMLDAVKRAVGTYYDREAYQALVRNAMSGDFSWNASAREYGEIYDSL